MIEIRLDELIDQLNLDNVELKHKIKFKPYEEISEYPSTYRDISFAFSDPTLINKLENIIEKYENIYLKESFVFDYYHDAHSNRIKLDLDSFFIKHQEDTLTDETVDIIMDEIIKIALTQGDIEIPGLHKMTNSVFKNTKISGLLPVYQTKYFLRMMLYQLFLMQNKYQE